MRVLIVVPFLSGGGAEFVAFQWARYLAGAGDVVTVYATHSRGDDVTPDGVALHRAVSGSFGCQVRDLRRYLRLVHVDVVLGMMPHWNILSIAAVRTLGRTRRPLVAISGRALAGGSRAILGRSFARREWLARRFYRLADCFVAISHPVAAEAIAEYGLSEERVVVVPNPALAKVEGILMHRDSGLRAHGELDIVVPGRLAPEKRPLIAVDAAAAVQAASDSKVTLHFFGSGDLRDAVVARADALGVEVVMHGWAAQWFNECPPCSVVLLPSLTEGFGNVLVEAAAAGFKSVVSSRCLGAADAVVPGITGELISGRSSADYASAILAISREPVRNADAWLQRFSFENSGKALRGQLVDLVSAQSDIWRMRRS
jgi:glycosyltransferase involved in cell wall biosynthesis